MLPRTDGTKHRLSLTGLSVSSFIIIIIIRQQLGLDRPVSTSPNSLFTGLPSRLRPFGIHFSIILAILLLLILATCSQSDLYLLSFLSAGSAFNSSKIS